MPDDHSRMTPFDKPISEQAAFHLRQQCELTDLMILGWPVVKNPLMIHGVSVAIGGTNLASLTADDEIHMAPSTYTSLAIPAQWKIVEDMVRNVQHHLEAKRAREKEGGA